MILTIVSALIFALSLCADCFAVSLCSSVTLKTVNLRSVGIIGIVFGLVQAGLMMAGYAFGDLFVGYVEKAAHWIGFLLLLIVGGSMIKEAFAKDPEIRNLNGFTNIIVASIATSIDALAVGISLSMGKVPIGDALLKGAAVFVVTVASVMVGMFCGHRIGRKFGGIAEFVGGCVLILIGLNILFGFV